MTAADAGITDNCPLSNFAVDMVLYKAEES